MQKPETVPCPYKSLPATSYWRRAVSVVAPDLIDPVLAPRFRLSQGDRVATAGSCFAQHIARYIRQNGFNYFVTEPAHPLLDAALGAAYNYGTFSARFGNIYTVRQLLQLFERAYGLRKPADDVWEAQGSSFIDPYRPFVQEGGFTSMAEFNADRAQHFAAVRRMIEEADTFVFTLGLTEGWESTLDGSVYPVCPGCGAGQHVVGASRFRNFTVDEVTRDLSEAIAFMRARNPRLKVLLTVSPVPLIATFEATHVLTATTYSKSVLRVAAQAVVDAGTDIDYFPSYEIITSAFSRGSYYGPDLREVEERGVQHAMRCFFKHYYGVENQTKPADAAPAAAAPTESLSYKINKVICDEEQLDDGGP